MAQEKSGYLQVKSVNRVYSGMTLTLAQHGIHPRMTFSLDRLLKLLKSRRSFRARLFVLNFQGDVNASGVDALAKEISAVMAAAEPEDEVLLKLESPGGAVHAYGLASAELERLKKAGIRLTVCVDKVAASGGYMMACVADKIIAAPLAVVGSIGVIAQVPNIAKLLDKVGVRYEQMVAGEHKQPLSVFTENTEEGRARFRQDIERTHELFRHHVQTHRSIKEFDRVADGRVYYGQEALARNLVDELGTSEETLVKYCQTHQVFELRWQWIESWADRLGWAAGASVESFYHRVASGLFRF